MPANTAWIHVGEELSEGFVPADFRGNLTGLARCYKLGNPQDLDGDGILDEYVVVRILYRREHMHAEIAIFPCDETGCPRGESLMRRMGSFPLVPCPKGNPDAIEFAIGVAFKFYDIEVVAPPPPPKVSLVKEPKPEPDNGLDYDPDDIPTYD